MESLVNRNDHRGREFRMADFRAQMHCRRGAEPGEPGRRTLEAMGGYPGPKQGRGGVADQAGLVAAPMGVGSADVGRKFGNREAQLPGDLDSAHRIAAKDFGSSGEPQLP